jgi:hypothetical protein
MKTHFTFVYTTCTIPAEGVEKSTPTQWHSAIRNSNDSEILWVTKGLLKQKLQTMKGGLLFPPFTKSG